MVGKQSWDGLTAKFTVGRGTCRLGSKAETH